MTEETNNGAAAEQKSDVQFAIHRIYIRDLSFESPKAPDIFRQNWTPSVHLDLGTEQKDLGDDQYEVVLKLSVTVKNEADNVAFIAEVQQAGIFLVKGIDGAQRSQVLGAFCPNVLFPYAREALDSVVSRGTFPALMLAPVNFDSLYAQELARMQQNAGEAPQVQ